MNVREAIKSFELVSMKTVEFVANDEQETVLKCFSKSTSWTISNKNGLYLTYDNFIRAIGDFYALTGTMDFNLLVPVYK